jgi:hypothetical protein
LFLAESTGLQESPGMGATVDKGVGGETHPGKAGGLGEEHAQGGEIGLGISKVPLHALGYGGDEGVALMARDGRRPRESSGRRRVPGNKDRF